MALTLLVEFLADASKLQDEAKKAGGSVKVLGKDLDIGVIAKGAAVAGAVGLAAAAITDMTLAAADDRAEQEKLALAIANAGAAQGDWKEQVDAAIESGQAKAFSDTEQRAALEALVGATGSVTTATSDLAIAQDIARASGATLEQSADAIAKAHAGQDGALAKLLPGLEKGATATDTIAAAQKRAAGQADLYAKSTKGMGETGSIAFGELTESIGEVFLPILDALIPALLPILKAFSQLVKALLPVLTPMIKLLGAALAVVAGVLVKVVDAVVRVVTWFSTLIGKVGDLLSKLGPLKAAGDFVGGIIGGKAVAAPPGAPGVGLLGVNALAGGGGGLSTGASVVINITATGDSLATEQAVMRALRRSTRLNAGSVPSWTAGG